jgi:hypothetical protein
MESDAPEHPTAVADSVHDARLLPSKGEDEVQVRHVWARRLVLFGAIAGTVGVATLAQDSLGKLSHKEGFWWLLGFFIAVGVLLRVAAVLGRPNSDDQRPQPPTVPAAEHSPPTAKPPTNPPPVESVEKVQPLGARESRVPNPPLPNRRDNWFELLKLEYDKGADRYENIYKAVWQNFSYSVAVGAALLTFGAGKLRLDLLQFAAMSPVVFWFVATFIPMNFYGELTRARLRTIERDFNEVFFYNAREGTESRGKAFDLGFRHFTTFASARSLWRVGDVVQYTGALVGLYWIWVLASVLTDRTTPLIVPQPPAAAAPVSVASPDSTRVLITREQRRLDSLRSAASAEQRRVDALKRITK